MQDYKEFLKYLNSYWFKKPDNEYNFSDILQKFEGNIDNLNTFYFTNNITESIHAKINYYLPRHISSEYNFINLLVLIKELIIRHMEQLYKEDDYYFRKEQMGNSLYNVLINNYINNSNIVRKD